MSNPFFSCGSVFICRSPKLQVFVCCFPTGEKEEINNMAVVFPMTMNLHSPPNYFPPAKCPLVWKAWWRWGGTSLPTMEFRGEESSSGWGGGLYYSMRNSFYPITTVWGLIFFRGGAPLHLLGRKLKVVLRHQRSMSPCLGCSAFLFTVPNYSPFILPHGTKGQTRQDSSCIWSWRRGEMGSLFFNSKRSLWMKSAESCLNIHL